MLLCSPVRVCDMLCIWITSCLIKCYYLQMLVTMLSVAMVMLTGHHIYGLPMVNYYAIHYNVYDMLC